MTSTFLLMYIAVRRSILLLALAACGNPAASTPAASIRVIRSPGTTDTIGGFFSDSLVLEVRGDNGLPVGNTRVNLAADGFCLDPTFTTSFTDPAGQVRARLRAGHLAGTCLLFLVVPALQLLDTLELTILPGAPASVTVAPDRVVLAVGSSQTYVGKAFDRGGNQLSQNPVLVPFGEISVNGSVVTATGPGNHRVEARAGPFTATALVDVVPLGKVTYRSGDGQIVSRNLDGRGLQVLMTGGSSPVWMVDGTVLAVAPPGLVRITGVSSEPFLVGAPADLQDFGLPTVSADGLFVYFLASRVSDPVRRVYRASVNGTGAVALPIPEIVSFYSATPDPQVIAYHTPARAPGRVYNLTTGSFFDFPPFQHFPWWSPHGNLMAFGAGLTLGVQLFTPDGMFLRTLHPELYFEESQMSWSSDERYLLGQEGLFMRLLDVQNGSVVLLPFLSGAIGSSIRIP